MPEGSVTHWIEAVKAGDEAAAEALWNRYVQRLLGLCRRRLAKRPRRAADEEDIALSAFENFFEGARGGRFGSLHDRDNLWRLLIVLASRKAADYVKHEARAKRGGGAVRGESAFAAGRGAAPGSIEEVVGREPTPELAAIVAEEYEQLLGRLKQPVLRTIAQLKLEGYAHEEIAQRLGCSVRTIERKLFLIRATWSDKAGDPG